MVLCKMCHISHFAIHEFVNIYFQTVHKLTDYPCPKHCKNSRFIT